jgi:hypothetical protein
VSRSKRTEAWEFTAKSLFSENLGDAITFERLEENLVDAEWLREWVDFLRSAYASHVPAEHRTMLPGEILERRDAALAARRPQAFDETPQRLLTPIEVISTAGAGLAALIDEGRLSRSTFLDILLHPAAVVDLHVALYTSDSLYWIGRVKKALRLAAQRADAEERAGDRISS